MKTLDRHQQAQALTPPAGGDLATLSDKPAQYSAKIDSIVYSDATRMLDSEGWKELAIACLDQAGISPEEAQKIAKAINGAWTGINPGAL